MRLLHRPHQREVVVRREGRREPGDHGLELGPGRELMEGLRGLDVDLTRHVLIEDGVLFPLALALEEELQRDD